MIGTGLGFALLAAIGWGVADFLVARTGVAVGERQVFAIVQPLGAGLLFGVVLLGEASGDSLVAWDVLVVGLLGGVALLSLYTALRRGPVAIASSIGATYGGVAAGFAVVFGNEQLGVLGLAGAVAITAGVVLVSADPRAVRAALVDGQSIRPTVLLAGTAALGLGASNYLLDGVTARVGPIAAVLGVRVVGAILGAPFLRGVRSVTWRSGLAVVAIATLDTGAFLAYAFGIRAAQVAIVTPVASLFGLVTVGLARLLLGERLSTLQWAGVAFVIVGTPLLAA